MATDTPLVSVAGLGFAYPSGLRVIGDLGFTVRRGEILSIVGPSGCGKSTLLRLLAGLKEPTAGNVIREWADPSRHPCTMMFQEDTLLPWLRVKDNVGLYYRFRHSNGSKHVRELLEMVGLADFAGYYPKQLSGGMKRRVAMLKAVAPHPELLLLDEPFSALDEPSRVAIHREVYMLVRRLQITAVLVTHDLGEAITLSDRIILLSRAPARVVEEYEIPFPRDRDISGLRTQAEFLELYGRLWNELNLQIARD
jgi:NitT/TauT family transport system ATP-binding protein